jgi:hypothetical protein
MCDDGVMVSWYLGVAIDELLRISHDTDGVCVCIGTARQLSVCTSPVGWLVSVQEFKRGPDVECATLLGMSVNANRENEWIVIVDAFVLIFSLPLIFLLLKVLGFFFLLFFHAVTSSLILHASF